MTGRKELLQVKNLNVSLFGEKELIQIVYGVNLRIHEGETVGLIGPTGAGKTVTARRSWGYFSR